MQKWIGEAVSKLINNKVGPFYLEKDDYKKLVMEHDQLSDFMKFHDPDGSMFEAYWVFNEATHGTPTQGVKALGGYSTLKKNMSDKLGRWSSDAVRNNPGAFLHAVVIMCALVFYTFRCGQC